MLQPTGDAGTLPDSLSPELPAPLWRIMVVGLLALMAGIIAVRYTRGGPSASYPGQITARIIPLTAEQDGLFARWFVEEGQPIRIGDPIFAISNTSLVERRNHLEQQIAKLKVELDRALAQADLDLEWRTKDVNAEIFTARLQSADLLEEKYRHEMQKVALADVLTANSTALLMPKDSVFDSIVVQNSESQHGRLSTVLAVEAATNSADVCTAQVEICEEQVELLEELKTSLPERVRRSVGVDVLERQLQITQLELEQLTGEQPQAVVSSAVIGQAGVFLKQPGEYVQVGDRVVEIFDDVQRFVIVEVPSGMVNEFQVGREFPLRFPGGVERTGRVTRVAPQATTPAVGQESVVRVHLEPAGILWPHVPIESQVMVCVP